MRTKFKGICWIAINRKVPADRCEGRQEYIQFKWGNVCVCTIHHMAAKNLLKPNAS